MLRRFVGGSFIKLQKISCELFFAFTSPLKLVLDITVLFRQLDPKHTSNTEVICFRCACIILGQHLKRKHSKAPYVQFKDLKRATPRQCPYCDETLSIKKSWDNHMKRKHSKRLFVQFNDLQQVKAAQEGGPKDEAVLTTP